MKKTKEQLINDYKKSNKERREKIAKANGFSTGEEYLASLQRKKAKMSVKKTKEEKVVMDYVVAFDTTGSMSSYIGNVKKHVETLIPDLFSKGIDLKMRIIAFGDYCDMGSPNAYQQSEFTDNQTKLMSFVQGAKSTSGGDAQEFYELVIKKIVEETPWRENSTRVVLFIADDSPHPVGYTYSPYVTNSQIDWRKEAQKAAEKKIAFDTLSIHGDMYAWYKELAQITKGVYMPFKSSNKMAEVVGATAYVRGTAASKATFTASMNFAETSGDSELSGVYKSLSTLL